jgi:hypothetical protein
MSTGKLRLIQINRYRKNEINEMDKSIWRDDTHDVDVSWRSLVVHWTAQDVTQ